MLHLKTFHTRSIGWALFGVNFRPLQEIEAIMWGGRIFDNGPFFTRLKLWVAVGRLFLSIVISEQLNAAPYLRHKPWQFNVNGENRVCATMDNILLTWIGNVSVIYM